MKKILVLSLLFVLLTSAKAQYESAVFDYEMAYFNNGQALPAEAMLIFSGEINSEVIAVEIGIYKPNGKKPLYQGLWQRTPESTGESFRLPVNYRLQGGNDYDFKLNYFRLLNQVEKSNLKQKIAQQILFYRKQHLTFVKGKLGLKKSPSRLFADFNQILEEELNAYRSATQHPIQFTAILEKYLKVLEKDTLVSSLGELDELLEQDINEVLAGNWWVVTNSREVQDYPTEKIANALALNVGYGGVLLSGQADNFTYGSAPYIGLSIPLSNRAYASSVLRNTSVSLGAFTQNFESPDGEKITGPIFGRPYFAGLGYSLFRFIRINAGLVALETQPNGDTGGSSSFQLDRMQVQPFVGLSAEIKFSVGFNHK